MDDHVTPAMAQSSAARAFEDLRGEVSLLRRAIEGLTAERGDQPDYGPTLESLAASNDELRKWARKISERPALQLTPQQIGQDIEAVTSRFRQLDRQELEAELARLAGAIEAVRAISRKAQTHEEQVRRVKIVGGSCFLIALILGLLLAQLPAL
jgi:hypothetical protein